MNNNLETLDILSIISFVIAVLNYQENLKQASNNELLKELKNQDVTMNDKIINKLKLIELQNKEMLDFLKGGKNEN